MFATYLRRELSGRKRQTIIVAAGLAVAIALVIVVNALAAGIRDAQSEALSSVYGVGTDLTVTGAAAGPGEGGGQRFDFGSEEGTTSEDGTTQVSQSRLTTQMGRGTLAASTVQTVSDTDGVAAVSGALSLTNVTFDGALPSAPDASGGTTQGDTTQGDAAQQGGTPPEGGGGPGGFGGGSFDLNSVTVLGVDDAASQVGPLSSVTVTDGRTLEATDSGSYSAVVDATYATTNDVTVGSTLDLGGETFTLVGVVSSASDAADAAADVFIPLDVAQDLSGVGDVVSTVYVQADSAAGTSAVQSALQEELPDATVSSQADLAASVSGSLSSASGLITSLGTWLSILVLGVAVLLAILFTISGVTRRTREFGTLKAIDWSNGRIVRQVAGESLIQGLIGGAVGVIVGVLASVTINAIQPTISAATAASDPGGGGEFPGGGMPGAGGPGAQSASAATDIALSAPLSIWIIVAAVALAIAGGLVAGAIGGWRAARLSPAEALRSVA